MRWRPPSSTSSRRAGLCSLGVSSSRRRSSLWRFKIPSRRRKTWSSRMRLCPMSRLPTAGWRPRRLRGQDLMLLDRLSSGLPTAVVTCYLWYLMLCFAAMDARWIWSRKGPHIYKRRQVSIGWREYLTDATVTVAFLFALSQGGWGAGNRQPPTLNRQPPTAYSRVSPCASHP